MGLLGTRLGAAGGTDEAGRLGRAKAALRQAGEARLGQPDQFVMLDLAGRDQDQPAGAVELGPPEMQVVHADRTDADLVAED